MADDKKIEDFFKKVPIKYESKVGHAQVSLTLQQQCPSSWKRGIDHLCYADLTVEYLIGIGGEGNRNPSLSWKPGYLHVNSRGALYFDGLFEKMHEQAEEFSELLAHGDSRLSVHELRRAFDTLEDKFKGDFDNDEFRKHFVNPNAEYDD